MLSVPDTRFVRTVFLFITMNNLLFVFGLVIITSVGYAENEEKDARGTTNSEKTTDTDEYEAYIETEPQASEAQAFATTSDQQPETSGQFYPSFAPFEVPPLGHSRPFYDEYQQEGAYSQRAQPPFQQNIAYDAPVKSFSGYKDSYEAPVAAQAQQSTEGNTAAVDILGDGNFGVIKGGTFYPDKEHEAEGSNRYEDFGSFFHNGHGRPSFYGFGRQNPKPTRHEQFANFKDFAEINSPPEREYSHIVVVYTNQNDTNNKNSPIILTELPRKGVASKKHQPKNIIESLAMLDLESSLATKNEKEPEEWIPEKKLSKSKRKLAKLLPEKKYKLRLIKKQERELHDEPLLALS